MSSSHILAIADAGHVIEGSQSHQQTWPKIFAGTITTSWAGKIGPIREYKYLTTVFISFLVSTFLQYSLGILALFSTRFMLVILGPLLNFVNDGDALTLLFFGVLIFVYETMFLLHVILFRAPYGVSFSSLGLILLQIVPGIAWSWAGVWTVLVANTASLILISGYYYVRGANAAAMSPNESLNFQALELVLAGPAGPYLALSAGLSPCPATIILAALAVTKHYVLIISFLIFRVFAIFLIALWGYAMSGDMSQPTLDILAYKIVYVLATSFSFIFFCWVFLTEMAHERQRVLEPLEPHQSQPQGRVQAMTSIRGEQNEGSGDVSLAANHLEIERGRASTSTLLPPDALRSI